MGELTQLSSSVLEKTSKQEADTPRAKDFLSRSSLSNWSQITLSHSTVPLYNKVILFLPSLLKSVLVVFKKISLVQ
jgi:hypothetical protein